MKYATQFYQSPLKALATLAILWGAIGSATVAQAAFPSLEATTVALSANTIDHAWLKALSQKAVRCAEQPTIIKENGGKAYNPLRSHCQDEMVVADDTVHFHISGIGFSVRVEENKNSDGNDLNDVYLLYSNREDQAVLVAHGVLSFGDPVLALLLVTGRGSESIQEVTVEGN